jgi:alginate O-acetyltransferase complex protein AlgI
MVFASPLFLFLFLPFTLLVYFQSPRPARNWTLLVLSVAFYTWGEAYYILLILASILFNWIVGLRLDAASSVAGRRLWLCAGIAGDLAMLGWFKYANFFADNINALGGWLGASGLGAELPKILLPLGISFYTFHTISYLVDVYRRSAPVERHLPTFALYILAFPQLIAGPIIRWKDIAAQFRLREETVSKFAWGVNRFVFGLAKKVLIANPLGVVADKIFGLPASDLSMPVAWLGLVCYTLQIYFDFSGYSDMAIGLMRMFGFRVRENFNYPYISRGIREFWRRWHISLSTWFRDYVYIPLGGNLVSAWRNIINIMIVFCLSGLWHGASWNFVLWGVWHGAFLCLETLGLERLLGRVRPLAHVYGLAAIMGGWVLFRAEDLPHAYTYYSALLGGNAAAVAAPRLADYVDRQIVLVLILGIIGAMPAAVWMRALMQRAAETSRAAAVPFQAAQLLSLVALFALSAGALAANSYSPFIYFRF